MKHSFVALCVGLWLSIPQVKEASAQRIFDHPELAAGLVFPENYYGTNTQQDDAKLELSGIRYGAWSTGTNYVSYANYSVLWDMYERIPAALMQTSVSGSGPLPVWDFRYWPEQKKYSWLGSNGPNGSPMAYMANDKFQLIDSMPIGNPHEFVILPNNKGYLAIMGGGRDSNGIIYPGVIWFDMNKQYKWGWFANDSDFGIVADSSKLANCDKLRPVELDTNNIDWFHENSIAWIQKNDSSYYVGVIMRNVNTEVRKEVVDRAGKGYVTKNRWVFDNAAIPTLFVNDVNWVEGPHAINYRYIDKDTLYVEIWDNASCAHSASESNYKLYKSYPKGNQRLMRLMKTMVPGDGQLGPAMGNGYAVTKDWQVSSAQELLNAPVAYNTGGHANMGVGLFGVNDANGNSLFEVINLGDFITYRFHAYLESHIPNLDSLRPTLQVDIVGDKVTLTAGGNYQQYRWLDGTIGKKLTVDLVDYCTYDYIAFAKNQNQKFWLTSHRYQKVDSCGTVSSLTYTAADVISMYPNPVQAGANLRVAKGGMQKVLLVDIAGRLVMETQSVNGMVAIPATLEPGMYLVSVEGKTQRLVVNQ